MHTIISVALIALVMITTTGWYIAKPRPLMIQGEVEATEINVAAKISGRIETFFAKAGMSVQAGECLATLDSPELRAKLEQAKAAQKAARAQNEKALRGTRTEQIRTAYNMWQTAKASSDLALKTHRRISRLYDDGVVPAQTRDETEAKLTAAQKSTAAARASYEMALAGARQEDKNAAQALSEKASGAVSEMEVYMAETRLVAPIAGEVVDIIAERGELISPGYPIVRLVDLDDIWVTFNLREDLLAPIRMGTPFHATIPALGNRKIALTVSYISPLGDFATWRATKTSGDFDLKTFEVRAVPDESLRGLRPGMSAIVNWNDISHAAGKGEDNAVRK